MRGDDLILELAQLHRQLVADVVARIKQGQLGECWGTDDPDEWRKELQEDAPAEQQRRAA